MDIIVKYYEEDDYCYIIIRTFTSFLKILQNYFKTFCTGNM